MLAIPPCPVALPTRVCVRCKREKDVSHFGKALSCEVCRGNSRRFREQNPEHVSEYNRRYREQNRAQCREREHRYRANNLVKIAKNNREYRETIEGRAQSLFNASRTRLRDGFTLTLEHVVAGLKRGHCAATGIPFDLKLKGGRQRSPYSPSLDKIDPKKPYTNENTRVVIWQYNAMKFELSDKELLEICRLIVARATT